MSKQYNFKAIKVVPTSKNFIDIVLSKTQRKTPTVVHKGYSLNRIKEFYTRKVKYTQQSFHDKLTFIITEFPKLEDVHPFYADLMNVLYDKDHYKLALGSINTARHLIDNVAKEYVRLLKYGDSLYRCKQLKRAALGRMCTIMKRQSQSLAYLEQVRQHLSRLPSIDPNARTILICGFPNVGKSSFINKITRADVEVQPYAFTTKSLFVGHTDYRYVPWQIIDTPGILDHELEARNTIEMQAITALAHLRAAVLFVMDLSEQCGFRVDEQMSLFENIRPLFVNKPLMVVVNKCDTTPIAEATPEAQAHIAALREQGVDVMEMSTLTEDGVSDVKNTACEKLLAHRVEAKKKGQKITSVMNRLHVAMPKARDRKERPACIPQAILERRAKGLEKPKRKTLREYQLEDDDYITDLTRYYLLKEDEWKSDVAPQVMDGKNIADFIDPDIMSRLQELEAEDEQREQAGEYNEEAETLEEKTLRERHALIQERRRARALAARAKKSRNAPVMPIRGKLQAASSLAAAQRGRGGQSEQDADGDALMDGARSRSRSQAPGSKRGRDASESAGPETRSQSRGRSLSRVDGGISSEKGKKRARQLADIAQRKGNMQGRASKCGVALSLYWCLGFQPALFLSSFFPCCCEK
eukprot:m.77685 g.77685  ORF g.77685 m.77685 type:complete len:641 (+) comp14556_c0_seq2:1182-3104(+)